MDAIKYFREKKRMTMNCQYDCRLCPLGIWRNEAGMRCRQFELNYPEEAVESVERWVEEHAGETRQSEFLKLFPKVKMNNDGIIDICPETTERTYSCSHNEGKVDCDECLRKYWLAEIGEEE